ncbi:hypothetical protein EJB05_36593 [Eragrostis curvula]|uniref:Uncharacterized protein n=1 Tax=Eragrostis curvula TaxID=38414 RepID=A0A5J9UA03_9POAL|nr:hypothetical protein EJB05_36593 [Eragrostis curvula]
MDLPEISRWWWNQRSMTLFPQLVAAHTPLQPSSFLRRLVHPSMARSLLTHRHSCLPRSAGGRAPRWCSTILKGERVQKAGGKLRTPEAATLVDPATSSVRVLHATPSSSAVRTNSRPPGAAAVSRMGAAPPCSSPVNARNTLEHLHSEFLATLVKPDKARGVEDVLVKPDKARAQTGGISEKVSEERLISLLEQINNQTCRQTKVTIQRCRSVLLDDD